MIAALDAGVDANFAKVKRLVDDGADINIKGQYGHTPLHFAANIGQTRIALAFIKAGADIYAWDTIGRMPLHYAAWKGHTETAFALVKAGTDINAKSEFGSTPLHYTAIGNQPETALALVKAGADIDAKGHTGKTPLHEAAQDGNTEVALAFVKAGADIDTKDNDGDTPLIVASKYSQTETMLALIKAGADVNEPGGSNWALLAIAISDGNNEIALALIKAGADVNNAGSFGTTPLIRATERGQKEIVLALIHAGAYLKVKDIHGRTPLDIARETKQWGIVQILQNPPPPKPSDEQEWQPATQEEWDAARPLTQAELDALNFTTTPAPEDSNVAVRVFDKGWRSVVYIESGGMQGGGVIIRPDIVATNCHVVDSGSIIVYKSNNRRTDKSKSYRATIRRRDDKRDFCLLDVSGLRGVPANVRRYDTLQIGESVYGIGAPQGLDLSLLTGVVSQKRTDGGVRKIQTNVAISPGSSGGGLFDRKGNLVGILTSKLVDEEVEGIGFAIPADLAL